MKTDLRIIKTNNTLYDALINLLKEKTFEEIKVSDICQKALVNRSTFYAHFIDKYELFMSLINRNLGIFTKIKLVLFDSLIANIEINIFLFSLILNVLFIFFGNPIILSIELLFIVGIYPNLTCLPVLELLYFFFFF